MKISFLFLLFSHGFVRHYTADFDMLDYIMSVTLPI